LGSSVAKFTPYQSLVIRERIEWTLVEASARMLKHYTQFIQFDRDPFSQLKPRKFLGVRLVRIVKDNAGELTPVSETGELRRKLVDRCLHAVLLLQYKGLAAGGETGDRALLGVLVLRQPPQCSLVLGDPAADVVAIQGPQ